MIFPFIRSRMIVGLSLHQHEARLIKLKKSRKHVRIESVAIEPLPAGVLAEGKIQDANYLTATLKGLIQNTHSTHCCASLALPASCVFQKRIRLPSMLTDIEQEAEITANIQDYLPHSKDTLCFDFSKVNTSNDAYNNTHNTEDNILISAARAEQLERYTAIMDEAGLHLRVIDIDTHALARAVRHVMSTALASRVAILDIEAGSGVFIVLTPDDISFSYALSFDINTTETLSNIILQTKHAMQLYTAAHAEQPFTHLFLSGNIHLLPHLQPLLQKETPAIINIINPFSCTDLAPSVNRDELSHLAPSLTIAFGLAIRRIPQW